MRKSLNSICVVLFEGRVLGDGSSLCEVVLLLSTESASSRGDSTISFLHLGDIWRWLASQEAVTWRVNPQQFLSPNKSAELTLVLKSKSEF